MNKGICNDCEILITVYSLNKQTIYEFYGDNENIKLVNSIELHLCDHCYNLFTSNNLDTYIKPDKIIYEFEKVCSKMNRKNFCHSEDYYTNSLLMLYFIEFIQYWDAIVGYIQYYTENYTYNYTTLRYRYLLLLEEMFHAYKTKYEKNFVIGFIFNELYIYYQSNGDTYIYDYFSEKYNESIINASYKIIISPENYTNDIYHKNIYKLLDYNYYYKDINKLLQNKLLWKYDFTAANKLHKLNAAELYTYSKSIIKYNMISENDTFNIFFEIIRNLPNELILNIVCMVYGVHRCEEKFISRFN